MKVAFCFPGQGSQFVGMGQELVAASPEARRTFEESAAASGLDLERLCFEGPADELTRTDVQQPALVSISLACLAAVGASGYEADVVVGHSVGEYAALAASGALDAVSAVRLCRERGLATAEAATEHPGAMAAILGLEDEQVEGLCAEVPDVWPANYNCPGQVVVSGAIEAVERLLELARERGARRTVTLKVTGAFHSPLVESAGPRLRPALELAHWQTPSVPFLSTVTAEIESGEEHLRELLVRQLSAPVRFTQAVTNLVKMGVETFVEIGPGQVLAGLVRRCDRTVTAVSVGDPGSLAKLEEVLSAD